jgi:hypothetical protein
LLLSVGLSTLWASYIAAMTADCPVAGTVVRNRTAISSSCEAVDNEGCGAADRAMSACRQICQALAVDCGLSGIGTGVPANGQTTPLQETESSKQAVKC